MPSVLIVHPFPAEYRRPFYGRLQLRLAALGWELGVADSQAPPSISARQDKSTGTWSVPASTSWIRVGGREAAWRRIGPLFRPAGADLIIVEQAIKNLETYPLLAGKRLGGPGVAMWGHGRSYSTPQGPMAAALKQALTRRGDWFFAYTRAGADHVVKHGFPRTRVSVVNNTIDTEALAADLARVNTHDLEAFERQHGLTPGRTALFLGGVDAAKGIDFLLESARQASAMMPGFVLLVGGAGDDLPNIRAAQAEGAPVRALGRLDGMDKAIALRATDVMAIPEWIGLVAVDSLVAGRPIVSTVHPSHSPEHEYLEDGVTAIFTAHSAGEHARGMVDLLESRSRLSAMGSACLAEAPRYPLDQMVDAFVEGILAWDELRRARL